MDLRNLFSKISFDRTKEQPTKKDAPSHWIKCPECNALMFFKEVENQDNICPKCNFHMRIGAKRRIEILTDKDSFVEFDVELKPNDPLKFVDKTSYKKTLVSKNEILISKRAENKKFGGMWECNGGSILTGETSLEGIIRELKEELGIEFSKKEAIFLKEVRRDKIPPNFKDLWLFKRDVKDEEITFPDGETTDFMWVTIDKFIEMYNNEEIVPTVDFGREEYEEALKLP